MKVTDVQMTADPGKAFYTKDGVRIGTTIWQSAKKRSDFIIELDESNPFAPENLEATVAQFTALIDTELDSFAQTRGYTNIITATTYDNDKDPQFAAEGKYCKDLRSDVYRLGLALITEYLGRGEIPTWEEIKAQLPVMEWPDAAGEERPI